MITLWQKTECKYQNKFFRANSAQTQLLNSLQNIWKLSSPSVLCDPFKTYIDTSWTRLGKHRQTSKDRMLKKLIEICPKLERILNRSNLLLWP